VKPDMPVLKESKIGREYCDQFKKFGHCVTSLAFLLPLFNYIRNFETHIPDEHELCYPVSSIFLIEKIFSDLC
jgi:hypothetical protein